MGDFFSSSSLSLSGTWASAGRMTCLMPGTAGVLSMSYAFLMSRLGERTPASLRVRFLSASSSSSFCSCSALWYS